MPETRVAVDDHELFEHAHTALRGTTHGDTLAVYLALRFLEPDLPCVGSKTPPMSSGRLEALLDDFYTKRNLDLGPRDGLVCQIFHDSFKPRHSYAQNNWRDFFRYALGVGCLAPETLLQEDFLVEHRSHCRFLVSDGKGHEGCKLHPKRTRYIRGLDKPKLLHWSNPGRGRAGGYKIVNLRDERLVEMLRPLCVRVPIESLIAVLYFGAQWSRDREVTLHRFAHDFRFRGAEEVEYLFAVEVVDPSLRRLIAKRSLELLDVIQQPFRLTRTEGKQLTATERRVRAAAFREFVRQTYDYACAVCGLRVDTPAGRWEVQAAHIYPHRLGGSDDVRNGLALCHNHHWAFDEGLFSLDEDHDLIWSAHAVPTKLRVDGKLRLPEDPRRWPDQAQALAWHRTHHGFSDDKR